MNQTQRKYALDRINQILNTKINALHNNFVTQYGHSPQLPSLVFPNHVEIIKALVIKAFFPKVESNIKFVSVEGVQQFLDNPMVGYGVDTTKLVKAINQAELDASKVSIDNYKLLFEQNVTPRVNTLKAAANTANDVIMLGEDAEATAAINNFNNLEI